MNICGKWLASILSAIFFGISLGWIIAYKDFLLALYLLSLSNLILLLGIFYD